MGLSPTRRLILRQRGHIFMLISLCTGSTCPWIFIFNVTCVVIDTVFDSVSDLNVAPGYSVQQKQSLVVVYSSHNWRYLVTNR